MRYGITTNVVDNWGRRHSSEMAGRLAGLAGCFALGLFLTTSRLVAQEAPDSCLGTAWLPPAVGSLNSFGFIATTHTDYRSEITVAPVGEGLRLVRASCTIPGNAKVTSTMVYDAGPRQVEVTVNTNSTPPGLSTIDFTASHLSVASVAFSKWPAALDPTDIRVPYYSLPITWLSKWRLFSNIYFDWTASNATTINPLSAVYQPLTNGRRNTLHERIVARFSADFDAVLPDVPNPKSPYISALAGRLVYDLTGAPPFALIESTLDKLKTAGLKNCVVLIHSWLAGGRLPSHELANARLGGDAALRAAVAAGKSGGCYVGLHQNYVDYYPAYPRFDPSAIAVDSAGQRLKAWYDKLEGIQSFATKPTWMLRYASEQAPEVQRRFQTNASFVDVNSAIPPWRRIDMDASVAGAGMLSLFLKASTAIWQLERTINGGPVFGEGLNHWFWSGLLDGVEAEFGADNIKIDRPHEPLFVDFDILKIHPLQVNQGVGYTVRWLAKGQSIRQTMLLDAYRMQEIAFGHAPYVDAGLWNDIPEVIIEQNLLGPVARRYGTMTASSIQYELNGRWVDTNAAIQAKDWSRVKVQYSNGDTIVANARAEALQWDGIEVPQNGWVAIGPDLRAYTALVNGRLADYSETQTSLFANARNMRDMQNGNLASQPNADVESDSRLNSAGSVVDFGTIQTDGMVSISQDQSEWTVRTYPTSRNVIVRLSTKRFPAPRSVLCGSGANTSQSPNVANGYWSITTKDSNYCSWQ